MGGKIVGRLMDVKAVLRRKFVRTEIGGGQGMTEYAILIVVICALAVLAFLFRDQLAELWNSAIDSMFQAANQGEINTPEVS